MSFRKKSSEEAGRARDTSVFSDEGDSAERKLSDKEKFTDLKDRVLSFIKDYKEIHPRRGGHDHEIKELNRRFKQPNSTYDDIVNQLENFLFSYIHSKTGKSGVLGLFSSRMEESEIKLDENNHLSPIFQGILKKSAKEGHAFLKGLCDILATVYRQDPPNSEQPRKYFLYTAVSYANESRDLKKLSDMVAEKRAVEALGEAEQALRAAGLAPKKDRPGR